MHQVLYRAQYMHDCIEFLLRPLAQCYEDGGFFMTVEGVMEHFIPAVALVVGDAKEVRASPLHLMPALLRRAIIYTLFVSQGFACCGQTMGNYACRHCWVSKHQGSVPPFEPGEMRTAAHNAAQRDAIVNAAISKTDKSAAMAARSITDVDNGFAAIWFGANGMGKLTTT